MGEQYLGRMTIAKRRVHQASDKDTICGVKNSKGFCFFFRIY